MGSSNVWRIGAGALVAVGLAAACGENGAGPEDPIADCLAEAGVSGAAVAIRGFQFIPQNLSVEPGTTVTWVNCEDPNIEAHTSTSDEGVWASPLLSPGDVFTRTFDEAGQFPYHCEPHPNMTAAIVVES